jgi:hypothetical protein
LTTTDFSGNLDGDFRPGLYPRRSPHVISREKENTELSTWPQILMFCNPLFR